MFVMCLLLTEGCGGTTDEHLNLHAILLVPHASLQIGSNDDYKIVA